MWTAIKNFQYPASPAEARQAARAPGAAYVAGGTYLVAERPPDLHTLVAVRPLLSTEIIANHDRLRLGPV